MINLTIYLISGCISRNADIEDSHSVVFHHKQYTYADRKSEIGRHGGVNQRHVDAHDDDRSIIIHIKSISMRHVLNESLTPVRADFESCKLIEQFIER